MARQALIDLGTNTFNLLVFEDDGSGSLRIIHSSETPVFLGKGGLEQGRIAEDALQRGIDALKHMVPLAREHGAISITGLGCSTLRNATNAHVFKKEAEQLGVQVKVLRGEEEAEMILDGVRLAVPFGSRPTLVMDIGGGSIEFMLATSKALMWRQSFELGVTRLRERMPAGDPMTMDQELRIAEHLDAHLEPLWQLVERHEPHELAGSAGSFDSLAAMVADIRGTEHDPQAISMHFEADEFHALKDRILRMDRNERLAMPGLPAHRVDTIVYALIAIERVLIAGGIRKMVWSRYSLKEGAAYRLLRHNDLSPAPQPPTRV
jgi:exopolyphosphatase / guanosine-5'-triphosphate,3'-diphosphate pyrophosphatase